MISTQLTFSQNIITQHSHTTRGIHCRNVITYLYNSLLRICNTFIQARYKSKTREQNAGTIVLLNNYGTKGFPLMAGDLGPVYMVSGTRDNPPPELPWES